MVLSRKFSAYIQKMFLQEHDWGGSDQYSEFLKILGIL